MQRLYKMMRPNRYGGYYILLDTSWNVFHSIANSVIRLSTSTAYFLSVFSPKSLKKKG
ncbi:hypothetical protein [Coleofasciculus sp. E1-EBD-02]|uniref:hypothetical protein n=1 Tax=Coleofasciculus sp. E1-EBD-02 TaxID=3068481 RepID=UPI0032F0B1BD